MEDTMTAQRVLPFCPTKHRKRLIAIDFKTTEGNEETNEKRQLFMMFSNQDTDSKEKQSEPKETNAEDEDTKSEISDESFTTKRKRREDIKIDKEEIKEDIKVATETSTLKPNNDPKWCPGRVTHKAGTAMEDIKPPEMMDCSEHLSVGSNQQVNVIDTEVLTGVYTFKTQTCQGDLKVDGNKLSKASK